MPVVFQCKTGCFALQKACFCRVKGAVLPYENVGTVMRYTSDGYAIATFLEYIYIPNSLPTAVFNGSSCSSVQPSSP